MKKSVLSFCAAFYFIVAGNVSKAQKVNSLFDSDSVLQLTLSGNLSELLRDRGDNGKLHTLVLSYTGEQAEKIDLPIQAKTRGHFRKLQENCRYPPLLLEFSKSDTLKGSIFNKQHKIKLVMPCQGDNYVIREWLVYKLYNLITPKSFKARLVNVSLNETRSGKKIQPFYGMILEDEKQMAKRNGSSLLKTKIKATEADETDFLKMAVFEYLIGNTDWSVPFLHNIKVISADSSDAPVTVAYDFDHAGIVNAPYAYPAEQLELSSVRQRRFRGYCLQDMKKLDTVFAIFNNLKSEIYALYKDCQLLDARYVKETLKYLDDFYTRINNPGIIKKEFSYPCEHPGTGNIVIKGINE